MCQTQLSVETGMLCRNSSTGICGV
jgi:hypothetical protein